MPDPRPVLEAEGSHFNFPPGFDPHKNPGYDALSRSLKADGQKVPVLACTALNGLLDLIDGLHRAWALTEQKRKVRYLEVEKPADDGARLVLIHTINAHRRQVSLAEKRDLFIRYQQLTKCRQSEIAAAFKVSETEVSRVLSTRRIPPGELKRLLDAGVCDSIVSLIGPLPTVEMMRKTIDFAIAETDGQKPGRDEVLLFIKRSLKGEKRGRKPRTLKGAHEGRSFSIALSEKQDAEDLAAWLRSMATKIAKRGGEIDVSGWGYLFK